MLEASDLYLDEMFELDLSKKDLSYWEEEMKNEKKKLFSSIETKNKQRKIKNYIIVKGIQEMVGR
jgi:hypothetical protein